MSSTLENHFCLRVVTVVIMKKLRKEEGSAGLEGTW